MGFIANEWSNNHILANDLNFQSWQHGTQSDVYNWVVGLDQNEIKGILGFIPLSKFDEEIDNEFIWLALWKVIEGPDTRGLGLRLLRYILTEMPATGFGVVGINKKHLGLYKALGFNVGTLKQYFMINPSAKQTLIHNRGNHCLPSPKSGKAVFKLTDRYELENLHLFNDSVLPGKTPKYFANRFLCHPIYNYEVHVIQYNGINKAIIASRIAEHNSSKVLRIVDFWGHDRVLAESGDALNALMELNQCEFCDFWQYGISKNSLNNCGFNDALLYDISVPNYFEPFVQKPTPIFFATKINDVGTFKIFRADGDQDRPNFQKVN
ncbi:hypothetical protein N9299_04340 [Amylibacter sp.]|nr:hypothetical protein [Amylibacter sp.]